MENKNFTTTISVDQSPAEVFNAINNVAGWWHGEVKGPSDSEGDEFTYRMKTFHYSKQRVIESIPDEKVVWLVTDSDLSFIKNKSEWTGTKIIFEILPPAGNHKQTQLRFTHEGLEPSIECYGACSNGWSQLIQRSLYNLITTGQGSEVF